MKKSKIILSIMFAATFTLVLPACDKVEDFGDTNTDPNATTAPVTSALLTNTLSGLGDMVFGFALAYDAALYAQYFSETQYTEASRYATQVVNWGSFYSGTSVSLGPNVNDLQRIIDYNSDPETAPSAAANGSNANQIAIARILKAYMFWMLTDSYGDLPYFEALKGEGILAYDAQSEIYPDLIKELKEAVDQFDGGESFKGDVLYDGDNSKWQKFANSIRVLIALRMSKVDAGTAQTEAGLALSHPAGVMEANDESATVSYPGGNYPNPVYEYYNITQRFDYALSTTMTSLQASTNDARRNSFGTTTKGFPYGLTRDDAIAFASANTDYSRVLSDDFASETASVVLIGAADIWLARAELAQRGWVTTTPVATAYTTGIQRSWEQWDVYDATAFNAYIGQSAVSLAANPLQKIQLQQWLSFYPNGIQGWSNWRRTGVPALTPAVGTATPDLAIPRRIPYGTDEFNLNRVNTEEASDRYNVGGTTNSQNGRVWWDVQ